jgi:hypothetical protein
LPRKIFYLAFILAPGTRGSDLWPVWHRTSEILPGIIFMFFDEMQHFRRTTVLPLSNLRQWLAKKLINL